MKSPFRSTSEEAPIETNVPKRELHLPPLKKVVAGLGLVGVFASGIYALDQINENDRKNLDSVEVCVNGVLGNPDDPITLQAHPDTKRIIKPQSIYEEVRACELSRGNITGAFNELGVPIQHRPALPPTLTIEN